MPTIASNVTPKKRALFLDALTKCGNVSVAAETSGISRQHLYRMRKNDGEFAAAWDEAAEIGIEALEDEARRRSHDGVDEPLTSAKGLVYDADGNVVTVRKYSDTLLIFLLKGAKPQKYRDRQQVEVSGQLDITTLAAEADAKFRAFTAIAATQSLLAKPERGTEG